MAEGQQPLAGLRVIEAGSSVPVAACGQQFLRWGAEVALLEPAAGSRLAASGPRWRKGDQAGSVAFSYFSAGKRIVRDAGAGLFETADVILLDESSGRHPCSVRALDAGLVVVSVTPFGLSGPRAAEAACSARLEALSGYLSLNGPPDGAPLLSPARLLDQAIGVNAFVGALAALIRRQRTGSGDLVEVSGLETIAGLLPYLREQTQGHASGRLGGTVEGARLLRCRDGYVAVAPAIPTQIADYREVLGATPQAVPDALLEGGRGLAADRVAAALAPYALARGVEEVFQGLQTRGVVCGVVREPEEVLDDVQLAALGFFAQEDGGPLQGVPVAGRPARMTGAPAWRPGASAPPLPMSAQLPRSNKTSVREAPLQGLRVLDLTQAWIGPIAGMILGDLGAEVIKVEAVRRPDVWRWLGQAPEGLHRPTDPLNRSCYFNAVNRNKLGLGLDLARKEGAEIFRRLAAQSDAVLENFTPSVMRRFGLDAERLRADHPELVVTSFSGFGAEGPLAAYKANGASIEALAGWDALHRDASGRPVLMGAYPADPICGLQMAACTLVALYRRFESGEGAHVEGSMLEAAAGYVGDALLAAVLEREGFAIEPEPPAVIVVRGERADSWDVLGSTGASTPVASTLQAMEDPQFAARSWFIPLQTPGFGVRRHNGFFWRFGDAMLSPPSPPPKLGEHTRRALSRVATPGEIDELERSGVAGGLP